jgi:hypothetical protein
MKSRDLEYLTSALEANFHHKTKLVSLTATFQIHHKVHRKSRTIYTSRSSTSHFFLFVLSNSEASAPSDIDKVDRFPLNFCLCRLHLRFLGISKSRVFHEGAVQCQLRATMTPEEAVDCKLSSHLTFLVPCKS